MSDSGSEEDNWLDPGPGARTSDATTRIFVGPPYEAAQTFANLLPSVHNYDSGGALSILADVAAACKTAPADLLRADYMARTGLGRRSMGATLDGSAAVGHGRITIMLPVRCAAGR